MYVVVSRLRVDRERADDLVEAFRNRAGLVEGADGFAGLEVWRSDRSPEEVLMVTRWRDRGSFSAYMRSEEHKASHGRIDPDLERAIRLERLEYLQTYDLVAT